jgi:hypothetical protein
MTTLVLKDQKLYFDGFNLTGDMNAIAINYSADMIDETTFGDSTHTMKGGLKTATMAHEGFWEGGTDKVDDVLFTNIGVADKPITVGVETGADGELAYMMEAILAEYTPGGSVGELFAFSVAAEASEEGLVRGTIMHTATQIASGNGTARQLGAVSTSQKVFAALHVIAASGSSPTLDVIVQSDDAGGFPSAVSQLTFAQATEIGGQFLSKAGAIADDFWRVNFTIGGGSPSFTFIVVIGIQ